MRFAEVETHAHRRKRKAAEKRKFSAALFDQVNCEQYIRALFTNPNGFHGTIHTVKNYFTTVFSVSVKISSIQTDPIYISNCLKDPIAKLVKVSSIVIII